MLTAGVVNDALGHGEEAARWMQRWSEAPAAADAMQPLWRLNPHWAAEMAQRISGGPAADGRRR